MTPPARRHTVCVVTPPSPPVVLRVFALVSLVAVLASVLFSEPQPALTGDGLAVTAALLAFFAGLWLSTPWGTTGTRTRTAGMLGELRAGARGYLTKDAGAEEIRAAVEAVARGEAALDPSIQRHVVAALAGDEPATTAAPGLPHELTPREAEVLALIAAGRTNAEIAEALVVSAATVKSHVNHIFAKTGVRDRAQAVVYAYENGLATSTRER